MSKLLSSLCTRRSMSTRRHLAVWSRSTSEELALLCRSSQGGKRDGDTVATQAPREHVITRRVSVWIATVV